MNESFENIPCQAESELRTSSLPHFDFFFEGLRFCKRWPCSTYISTELTIGG